MSTSVPPIVWTNGYPVLPTEAEILAGVQADQDTAFGGGLNSDLTTPQGQLAQSETAIIGDAQSQIAYIFNQINPETASGAWQDAIGKIYRLTRIPGSGTVVEVTATGAVGTVIPSGTVAQDTNGYLYASTASATIGSGGTVSVQFQNQTQGPIACAINALNIIYTRIAGLDTITNPAAGVIGGDVESRASFENRRKLSVAIGAKSSNAAILAAVLSVPDVIDAYVVDNSTNATVNYGSTDYPLVAHSVCVSVAGGDGQDIGLAILSNKSLGCDYNGNTTVTILDVQSGSPAIAYDVTYLIPDATPVYFNVQIKSNPALPSNISDLVKAAIVSAFSGADGGLRARINTPLYAGRFYAGVNATDPNVDIVALNLGYTAMTATLTALDFGLDQLPTLDEADIVVALVS